MSTETDQETNNVTLIETSSTEERTNLESTIINNEEKVETTEDFATAYGVSVFIPDFSYPFSLISSTHDRYNDTISNCLKNDFEIIQQKPSFPQSNDNNFFRNIKWSPDGSCLLSNSADNVIRLFQIPSNAYEDSEDADKVLPMIPNIGIREGESIYDFAWYPSMNMQDPSTCCFITSVRDHPVQLWDLYSGTVRASYRAIDHCERFVGPNALAFNLDGSKIYCGYENMIEIFDVQTSESVLKRSTVPTRKLRKRGQNGVISCLDFCPTGDGIYAAGSYSRSIGLYDEVNNELCLKLILDNKQGSGVTQVKFSPDGLYLFSASRQSNTILCWDIRNTANTLFELPCRSKTNQRIQFDLTGMGKYLVTGDMDGNALVYDVTKAEDDMERLVSTTRLHDDLVSSTALNPVYPVMATCSGQRKFRLPVDDDDDDDDDNEVVIDNTIKIWRMKGQYEWYSYDTNIETEYQQDIVA